MAMNGTRWLRRSVDALRAHAHRNARATTVIGAVNARVYGHVVTAFAPQQKRSFAMHASILSQMDLLTKRYDDLSNELSTNDGSYSAEKITNLSIEMADLEPKVLAVRELREKLDSIAELNEMISDKSDSSPDAAELRDMAMEERNELLSQIEEIEARVTRLMLPRDEADEKSSILEIRAGTGGDEACLFASDILKMYQKLALNRGWKFEVLSLGETDLGGVKECVCSITGRGAYGRMKYESGVHRVQRVPVNDVRVHTSAISVVVLPEVEAIDMNIDAKDLRIDVYRASGAGGQHVNTTESAVRITHIPTGIQAAVQDERSQHQNKAKAMKILCARVYDGIRRQRDKERQSMRASQVGSGDRSERIRTYNFPQSRVTDHRVNVTVFGIERMLAGELLDEIVDALVVSEQNELLMELEHKLL